MKKIIFLITAALFTSSANAWGEREQSALQGIMGTLILQQIYRNNQPPPVHHPQQMPPIAIPHPSYPPVMRPMCRQVLAIQIDKFGNEYRYPITICH